MAGVAQSVEHQIVALAVAGSNLVARPMTRIEDTVRVIYFLINLSDKKI